MNACKEYAQNAVNQFHALDGAGCQGAPGDKLWSGNYDQHFNWCMSSNGDLGHQFKRRRRAIEACQRHSDSECRKYADNAVNQTREAVRNSCSHIGPPVWGESFRVHYDWCKNNPNADLGHESKTRRGKLSGRISHHLWTNHGDGSQRQTGDGSRRRGLLNSVYRCRFTARVCGGVMMAERVAQM